MTPLPRSRAAIWRDDRPGGQDDDDRCEPRRTPTPLHRRVSSRVHAGDQSGECATVIAASWASSRASAPTRSTRGCASTSRGGWGGVDIGAHHLGAGLTASDRIGCSPSTTGGASARRGGDGGGNHRANSMRRAVTGRRRSGKRCTRHRSSCAERTDAKASHRVECREGISARHSCSGLAPISRAGGSTPNDRCVVTGGH